MSLLCFSCLSFGQVGMGEWRMHISPKKAISITHGNGAVYVGLTQGLLEYDLAAGEITRRTAANYLSDNELTDVYYHSPRKRVYIGYANGNLDVLENEGITNLNAITVAQITGSKRINRIEGRGNEVYLATGFGIVVINDQKLEVKDTYYPTAGNQPIIDLTFTADSIYALTSTTMYVGALSNQFLADPSQWRQANYIPNYSTTGIYKSITSFGNEIFLSYNDEIYNGDTLFLLDRSVYEWTPFLFDTELNNVSISNNQMLVSTDGGLFVYNSDITQNQIIFQYSHGSFPNCMDATFVDGNYFIADRSSGLVRAINAFSSQQILFPGPDNNFSYRVDWQRGKLSVAGGPGDRAGYTLMDEKWTSINMFSQPLIQGKAIPGFLSTTSNARNTDQVAFGSFSEMPLVITDDGVHIADTFSIHNSLLEVRFDAATSGLDWVEVSNMKYDNRGNLWVANSGCQRPLKVLSEAGVWYDYDMGSAARNRFTRRLVIDNEGVKWISIEGAGVFAYDDNGTLDDPTDDRFRLMNTNANSGNLPTTTVEALAVDRDNNIWVGTPEGMRVLYNSRGVFDAAPGDYNFQRLLIEFGENVEIVLGSTHITSIEIDGANRKWIGTANSGVFLFSSDGLTLIKNFTAENSPLLTNTVLDMTIDEKTGEVFFVTDQGMISYRSDASTGDNNYTNVTVFPNPVYPHYFGPITIQGIASNSEVKITDVAGNLVYRTASNGGTAIWDGRTLQGQRATTGVYLIWTSVDIEGQKGRKVGKVVFIN
jgi:ligand-binding sensor domain-containing protein